MSGFAFLLRMILVCDVRYRYDFGPMLFYLEEKKMRGRDIDALAWMSLYAALVGFQCHPGSGVSLKMASRRDEVLDNLGEICDDAFERFARRFSDVKE